MASRAYTTRSTRGSCLLLVSLDPKESALASASGQVEQRCWAPGHSGLRCSAPARPRDATHQPLPGHARIHPHIGIQPVASRVPIAGDHGEFTRMVPVRDGGGNQHPDLGVTPGPWLAEWRLRRRNRAGPTAHPSHAVPRYRRGRRGDGVRIAGFCTTILQFWSWSLLHVVSLGIADCV